jgi:H+-translocating NAD(P) transhydrogenase subunit alpha
VSANEKRSITIGLLRERVPGERRVALTPPDIRRLANRASFLVEGGAGSEAGFFDAEYATAGARVATKEEVLAQARVVVQIRPPHHSLLLRPGTMFVSLGGRDKAVASLLREKSVAHLGLERLPRTTRAQSMDVLSSQASIAGYAAVLEGARQLDVSLPMFTTAAGTIKPARMMALGAGVAGLQAIATARRLGAVAHGFDVRPAAREQVESLGAMFIAADVPGLSGEAAGGYAGEQSADEQHRLRRALSGHIATMRLIVSTAQIPGRPAPILIDEETVAAMQPGSVIVDLAAESGGNCTLTRPDELTTVHDVRILGPTNLPSTVATNASQLFSGNIRALLEHLIRSDGQLNLDLEDPITGALLADRQPAPSPALVA